MMPNSQLVSRADYVGCHDTQRFRQLVMKRRHLEVQKSFVVAQNIVGVIEGLEVRPNGQIVNPASSSEYLVAEILPKRALLWKMMESQLTHKQMPRFHPSLLGRLAGVCNYLGHPLFELHEKLVVLLVVFEMPLITKFFREPGRR